MWLWHLQKWHRVSSTGVRKRGSYRHSIHDSDSSNPSPFCQPDRYEHCQSYPGESCPDRFPICGPNDCTNQGADGVPDGTGDMTHLMIQAVNTDCDDAHAPF